MEGVLVAIMGASPIADAGSDHEIDRLPVIGGRAHACSARLAEAVIGEQRRLTGSTGERDFVHVHVLGRTRLAQIHEADSLACRARHPGQRSIGLLEAKPNIPFGERVPEKAEFGILRHPVLVEKVKR